LPEFKPNLDDSVARMQRLWALEEPLDRVPVSVRLPRPPGRKADGSFFGRLDDYFAYEEKVFRRQAHVADETLPVVYPQYGHALISALCGSPIRAAAETVWSVPIVTDLEKAAETLRLDWDNEWGQRYLADLARMFEWAGGRCWVGVYEVEGVADTFSALRGAQRFLLDLYDAPEAARRLAERITGLLVEFGRWQIGQVAEPQDCCGGTPMPWLLWMPAGSMCFAEDATVMLGPDLYRAFFRDPDDRLTSAFGHTLLEVHAEGVHHIPAFGAIDGVSCMTIPNPLDMQPHDREAVRALLGRKVFYTHAAPDRLEELLAFTGTRGVFAVTHARTVAEANELLAMLESVTDRCRGSPCRRRSTPA